MTKINFTSEHGARLKHLATEMLFNGTVINGTMSQVFTVHDLIHTTTLNTLCNLLQSLNKQIEKLENADEWVSAGTEQALLATKKNEKEFVNLLIGYKRYQDMLKENKAKRAALQQQLNSLKDAQKTPEDRIKELEAELAELGE